MSRDKKAKYYDAGGHETLDIIRAKLTPEQYRGYLLGNAIKYLCRVNWKGDPVRDLEKAINYITWLTEVWASEEDPEPPNRGMGILRNFDAEDAGMDPKEKHPFPGMGPRFDPATLDPKPEGA